MRPPKLQREGVTDMPLSVLEEGSQHCSRAPTLPHISGHLGRRLTYLWRAGWARCSTRRPHSSSRCRSRRGTSLDSPRPPGSLGSGTYSIQSGERHQHLPAPLPLPQPGDDPGHTQRYSSMASDEAAEPQTPHAVSAVWESQGGLNSARAHLLFGPRPLAHPAPQFSP